MTPLPPSTPAGSYDDLTEQPVQTVLSVPIILAGESVPPSVTVPKRRGRHARQQPVTQPTRYYRSGRIHAERRVSLRDEIVAALRTGLLSAAVVFVFAALGLVMLSWMP